MHLRKGLCSAPSDFAALPDIRLFVTWRRCYSLTAVNGGSQSFCLDTRRVDVETCDSHGF